MAGIPQVITEDRASGAQFIGGSLKFDDDKKNYLKRTPTTAGNRKTWTWSAWVKKHEIISSGRQRLFSARTSTTSNQTYIQFRDDNKLYVEGPNIDWLVNTSAVFRDTAWGHVVVAFDTTQATASNRVRVYWNGVEQTLSGTQPTQNYANGWINNTFVHSIGNEGGAVAEFFNGSITNTYFIDGQQLDASYFGFTDPLTNTWRPKKFSGEFSPKHIDNWNGVTTGTGFNSDTVTENAFDGNPDTQAAPGQNGTMSFTPAPAITGISKIRIKARRDAGQATPSNFTLNGTTIGDLWTAGNTATVEITSLGGSPITQLTNLTWKANTNNNEWFGVYQIEVYYNGAYHTVTQGGINDFYLPMDGNSPIGEDKSGVVTLNDGTTWSNSLTSNVNLNLAASRAFDGDATNSTLAATSNATNANLLFTQTFNNVYKLRVYMDHATNYRARVNGGTWHSDSSLGAGSNASWRDLTSIIPSGGTITSIESDTNGANNGVNWSAVEVNGQILVDGLKGNNWTPVGFGGFNTIEKATGALPILNTDGGGNTARPGTRNDAYASDIVMAIPFLDNVNDISADIRGSGSNLSVTTSGSPAADSDPTQWYGSSFNVSTSNYIDTIGTTTTFAFLHQPEAAGTVEGWINTNAVNVQGPWFQTSNGTDQVGVMFRQNSTTNLAVQINRGVAGQAIVVDSSITVALNTWYHWAFVKSVDGYAQFFLNGVPTGSKVPISTAAGASNAASTNTSSSFAGRIARNHGETRGVGANISDYRAYTIQKYAFDTPFIPASTNPDILPDTPSGITGKSKLTKITDGAVAFDGTGDLLQFNGSAGSNPIDFGTGDFTVEAFVYHTGGTDDTIISDASGWTLTYGAGGNLRFYMANGSNAVDANTNFISNQWVHIAVVRNSGTLVFYQNGIGVGSHSYGHDISANGSSTFIGKYHGGTVQNWKGYISNLRVVQGTSLYTSNFTPPTEPLTAVTNTKLLCCQSTTSETAAAVTPNAFTPRSGGYRFTTAKIYSTYGGGARAANYTVQWSDDNSSWTDAWSGNMSNNSSCGLQQGTGAGNPGSHRYWRYVEGGATAGHHPRVSRIVLSDGTTDVNIKVYVADNCSDNGDYQIGTTSTYEDTTWTAGTNNDATATTFNPFTDDINTIRGQETGYATLNPLDVSPSVIASRGTTLSDGNLTSTVVSGADNKECVANIGATSGKYYYEVMFNPGADSNNSDGAGWVADDGLGVDNSTTGGFMMIARDVGSTIVGNGNGSRINQAAGTHPFNYYPGDVMGCAIDLDSRIATWYKNGLKHSFVVGFSSRTNLNGLEFKPLLLNRSPGSVFANFGQKPFKFPPPDGFQPLSLSTVQPEKIIARPDQYVGTVLYNGDGGTSNTVTGLSFTPDVVWGKSRSNVLPHNIFDVVRGFDKQLDVNDTATEVDRAGDAVTPLSNGFILDATYCNINNGSTTNVAWCWKAGGNKNTFNIDDVGYANASDVNMNAGAFNGATYNTSDKWSDDVAGTTYGGAGMPKSKLFNGALDNNVIANSGTTLTFSPSGLSSISSLRFYGSSYTGNANGIVINGTDYTSSFPQGGNSVAAWVTIPETSLTSVAWSTTSGGLENGSLYAIEVDGKLLVDNDQTPPNVPSIVPTGCSVGTKQGFSIIKYTGSASAQGNLPHGLEQIPDFVICKNLSTTYNWFIWHNEFGNGANAAIYFTTAAKTTNFGTLPFASLSNKVITFNNNDGVNGNYNYVMYAWHNVPGLQKFGTYAGNGSGDGPFVELGFQPAIIWIKNISDGSNRHWCVVDSTRSTYNKGASAEVLFFDSNQIESRPDDGFGQFGTKPCIDILSNGFKLREPNTTGVWTQVNNTHNYIYCAWAEAPSINLYGSQSNAR